MISRPSAPRPETELNVLPVDDDFCSHMLSSDCGSVRVIRAGEQWPASRVKSILKEG
jgi:hypothetical protein